MRPSVGRIVHYRGQTGGECHAALVVRVLDSGNCTLSVFEFDGSTVGRFVVEEAQAGSRLGGQWHWPERVPEDPPALDADGRLP